MVKAKLNTRKKNKAEMKHNKKADCVARSDSICECVCASQLRTIQFDLKKLKIDEPPKTVWRLTGQSAELIKRSTERNDTNLTKKK